MKTWLLSLLLLSTGLPGWQWLMRVREHNAAQAQGQAEAKRGRPAEAVYYFQQAVALAGKSGPTPALLLDLAQAQVQAGQLPTARATYARLLSPAVPAAIGSTARQQLAVLLATQQQTAQALSLLRQALQLNSANMTARYNYELLSQYLAGQRPGPLPPPPALDKRPIPSPRKNQRDSTQQKNQGAAPSPGEKGGNDHAGQAPTPNASPQPTGPPTRALPNSAGQPDDQRPTPGANSNTPGGFRPGSGAERLLASGTEPGKQRGLDARATATSTSAPTGQGRRPGTEAAGTGDLQLQTQRERLKAMNLTPAQAQQLLDALRASEEQYLQQRPRARKGTAPAPGTPTW
jgi:predicted negative regulator of RcsB-dependent stress response